MPFYLRWKALNHPHGKIEVRFQTEDPELPQGTFQRYLADSAMRGEAGRILPPRSMEPPGSASPLAREAFGMGELFARDWKSEAQYIACHGAGRSEPIPAKITIDPPSGGFYYDFDLIRASRRKIFLNRSQERIDQISLSWQRFPGKKRCAFSRTGEPIREVDRRIPDRRSPLSAGDFIDLCRDRTYPRREIRPSS
jgi:hypothetical protein